MPWLTRRAAEWSILLVVVLALMGVFGRQFRYVQGQGELAAIKTTLGALRTALVVDYLQAQVATKSTPVAQPQRNPFLVLDRAPANYAGVLGTVKAESVPPGNWVFDPFCNCIGYGPMYPYALEEAGDAPMLWFRVSGSGPLQIAPVQPYRWQGEVVN
jgi:hypothetical protein